MSCLFTNYRSTAYLCIQPEKKTTVKTTTSPGSKPRDSTVNTALADAYVHRSGRPPGIRLGEPKLWILFLKTDSFIATWTTEASAAGSEVTGGWNVEASVFHRSLQPAGTF
jgi:hypothetical protein